MSDARDDYRTVADLEQWALAVDQRRSERARGFLEVLALVPPDQQATALRYVLEVEEADVLLEARLRHLWQSSVRLAYLDGRASAMRDSLPEGAGTGEELPDRNPTLH